MLRKRSVHPIEDTAESWKNREQVQRIGPPQTPHNVAVYLGAREQSAVVFKETNVAE